MSEKRSNFTTLLNAWGFCGFLMMWFRLEYNWLNWLSIIEAEPYHTQTYEEAERKYMLLELTHRMHQM